MGGQGSGYFNHAGRPGLLGGSASGGGGSGGTSSTRERAEKHREAREALSEKTTKAVKEFAEKYRDKTKEWMQIIDPKTGKVDYEEEGSEDEVGDPEVLEGKTEGKIQIHNHPVDTTGDNPDYPDNANKPPSAQDLGKFFDDKPKEFLVVSKDYTFSLKPPPGGFTEKNKAKAEALFKSMLVKNGAWRYPTHEDWQALAAKTGIKYTRTKQ